MKQTEPKCSVCGKSTDTQFSIFSPHGFGTYCVECEAKVDAAAKGETK